MMIAATTNTKTGRKLLIIGLEEENIRKLKNDEPIYKSLEMVSELEDWDISILGPEDLVRFVTSTGHGDELHSR